MSCAVAKGVIHFMIKGGNLVEHRLMSDPPMWPKNGMLYAMAADPVAIERCRAEAMRVGGISPRPRRKPLLGPGTRERLVALVRPTAKS